MTAAYFHQLRECWRTCKRWERQYIELGDEEALINTRGTLRQIEQHCPDVIHDDTQPAPPIDGPPQLSAIGGQRLLF